MKTVNFQGTDYEVPTWTRYMTQDANGTIKAFEDEPARYSTVWGSFGRSMIVMCPGAPMVIVEVV